MFETDDQQACHQQFIPRLTKLLKDRCIQELGNAGYNNNSHVNDLIDNLTFSYVAGTQSYSFNKRREQYYLMFTSTFTNPNKLKQQGEGYENVAICYCEGKNWWLDREVESADIHDWEVIRLNRNPNNRLRIGEPIVDPSLMSRTDNNIQVQELTKAI